MLRCAAVRAGGYRGGRSVVDLSVRDLSVFCFSLKRTCTLHSCLWWTCVCFCFSLKRTLHSCFGRTRAPRHFGSRAMAETQVAVRFVIRDCCAEGLLGMREIAAALKLARAGVVRVMIQEKTQAKMHAKPRGRRFASGDPPLVACARPRPRGRWFVMRTRAGRVRPRSVRRC